MDNVSQDPILAEDSISSQNGSTFSKKWKKSTFIFGSIMGLVVLIPIVFSIVNMVEDSSLKHEISSLRQDFSRRVSNLETEAIRQARTMEENQKKTQTLYEWEVRRRNFWVETILNEIKKIKTFVNYTAGILLRNINDLITNLIRSVLLVIFLYSIH